MDENDELTVALTPLIDLLDRLEVIWYVGGSVASTVHGRFRATNDVDVIADLREEHASVIGQGVDPHKEPLAARPVEARREGAVVGPYRLAV